MQRVLWPTDGSALSERALPFAERLARAHGADLVLVRVVEPPRWMGDDAGGYVSADLYQELVDLLYSDAHQSLARLADRFRAGGLYTRTVVLHGSPAVELLSFEKELRPDLVVMATHGRTGLARFALGCVTDRMVREGVAPVLVVRSFSPPLGVMKRAVVPLDGSMLAEETLPIVESLAGRPLCSVRLLRAIRIPEERGAAARYLEEVAANLSGTGLPVDYEVRCARPAEAIAAAAEAADIVIMATHGRGGFDRLRHGSVAEQAARHLNTPVLLVRAGMVQAARAGGSAQKVMEVV